MTEQQTIVIALINVIPATLSGVAALIAVWNTSPRGKLFRRLRSMERALRRHRKDNEAHPPLHRVSTRMERSHG